MKISRIAAIAAALVALSVSPAFAQNDASKTAGWRPLFDGKSLDGWQHVGPGEFVVDKGVLRTEGGMGLLYYSREKLGNCVIRVVYRTGTPRSNSGVYVRIADKPADPWFAVHHGFEVQIADGGPPDRSTGSIYTFARAEAQPGKAEQWNALDITLNGNTIMTVINGVPVATFDSSDLKPQAKDTLGEGDPARGPRPPVGYIGLQNHDPGSVVFFKEVSVRPLADASK